MSRALRWGLILGLVSMGWLYLTFWLGLHTKGVLVFQVVPAGWLVIMGAGYVVALHALAGNERPSFRSSMQAGATIAVVTALMAVPMQFIYFRVVHPAWPEFMVNQTREAFAARGASAAEIASRVDDARQYFSLRSYATQSALLALVVGLILSVIVAGILRRTRRASA